MRCGKPVATLLVCTMLCSSPFAHAAPGSHEDVTAKARLEADTIKGTALARLHTEASTMAASAKLHFTASIKSTIAATLNKLTERYWVADKLLEDQIGFFTPWNVAWQSWWHNQEAGAKVFQEKIEKAIADAGIPAARRQMSKALEAALADAIVALYTETRTKFNTILYEAIAERGLLGPLTPDLMQELVERIDYTGRHMAIKEGVIDAAPAQSLPVATLSALATILMARVTQAAIQRIGGAAAVRVATGELLTVLTGPIGTAIVVISLLIDAFHAKKKALDAAKEALWASCHALQRALLNEPALNALTATVVAGLEQQLQTDQKAAKVEIDKFLDGFLVQARSPGYLEFAQQRDRTEALRAFKQVALVFGRDLVEVPFLTKYGLTSDISAPRASEMLRMHGKAFVELYARQADALKQVMLTERYHDIVADVVTAKAPDAALQFYTRSLDRFGRLDAKQIDALILIHTLHPTKRAEDINKLSLTAIGGVYDRLAAITQHDPQCAATIVDWTLQGQISATMMQKLGAEADAHLLFTMPILLGIEPFMQIMHAANAETLVRFVRDFNNTGGRLDQSQAIMLLREDGPGHVRLYAQTERNPRAVLARHTLLQEYGGRVGREVEATSLWLLRYTSVEPHKGTIESLHTIGIPGYWPDVAARPMAAMVATWGVGLPLLLIVGIVIAPFGLLYLRIIRFMLPKRRREALAAQEKPVAIDVTPMRERVRTDAQEDKRLLE